MTAYKTTMEEGWALVDFMANVITEAQAGTHFTTAAHALMVVGELERGWLAAHDRAVKAEAWGEGWVAAQEVMDFEGQKVWAHQVLPEGYEGNPYEKGADA